jgi:hypothetical protein
MANEKESNPLIDGIVWGGSVAGAFIVLGATITAIAFGAENLLTISESGNPIETAREIYQNLPKVAKEMMIFADGFKQNAVIAGLFNGSAAFIIASWFQNANSKIESKSYTPDGRLVENTKELANNR